MKALRILTFIDRNKNQIAKYVPQVNKKNINNSCKTSILFATLLSLLCSSSVGCQEIVSTSKQEKATDSTKSLANINSFFPFGFYHVSWQTTSEQRLKALQRIAAAGFNMIHASIRSSDDLNDYGKFLDEAQKLGIKVITEFGVDRAVAINQFKNKPAVFGWNIADDVEDGKRTPQDVCQSYQQVKNIDPNHITYISGFSDKIEPFVNCSDAIGMQSYPIRFGEKWELRYTHYQMSITRDIGNQYNRPIYANLQSFNWAVEIPEEQQYKGARTPTVEEVRNMTYQALLAGANGIMYYAFQGNHWELPHDKNLWSGIKALAPEIKQLSPTLLNGKLVKLSTNVEDTIAGLWLYQNKATIVILNTSFNETKNVNIALPLKKLTNIKSMFVNRPASLSIKANKLSGVIKPKEVQVYTLDL